MSSASLRREEARRGSRITPACTPGELKTVAARLAEAYPDVDAVFLFGSLARGQARPGSDVDLAVLLREGASLEDSICLGVDMTACVEDLLGLPADVVVLQPNLDPGLLFDIFRIETIVFARSYDRAHDYACRARMEYRDLLPRLERSFERVRRSFVEAVRATHGS